MIVVCNYKKEIRAVFDSLHWEGVGQLRKDIEYYLREFFNIPSRYAQQVSTAIHELLQNTIQYGGSPVPFNENEVFIENKVELIIILTEEKITVKLINSTENKKALDLIRRLEDMQRYTPKEYYIREIKKTNVRGGLGLARVYYECQALIHAIYNNLQGTIQIKADFPLQKAG